MTLKEKYYIGKYIRNHERGIEAKKSYDKTGNIEYLKKYNHYEVDIAGAVPYDLALYRWHKIGEPKDKYNDIHTQVDKELQEAFTTKQSTTTYDVIQGIATTWKGLQIVATILSIPFIILLVIIGALANAGINEIKLDNKKGW